MPDEIEPSPTAETSPTVSESVVVRDVNTDGEAFPDKPIDFGMFARRRAGVEEPQEKPTVDATTTEPEDKETPETLEEPKVPEEEPKAPEAGAEEKPVVPEEKPTLPQSREQVLKELGIPEAEHKHYKFMSNDAFNKVKDVLKQNKTLAEENQKLKTAPKTEVKRNIQFNSEGYTADKEYQRHASATRIAESVKDHWTKQLANIREGKEWQDLGVDGRGNVYISGTKESSVEAETYVLQQRDDAIEHVRNNRYAADRIKGEYETRVRSDVDFLKQTEEKYFPGYDDENHPTKPIQQQVMQLLPKSQAENVLAPMLAKTIANNSILKKNWQEAEAKVQTLQKQLDGLKAQVPGNQQQPSKGKFQGNGTVPAGKRELTYSEINKIRQGTYGI